MGANVSCMYVTSLDRERTPPLRARTHFGSFLSFLALTFGLFFLSLTSRDSLAAANTRVFSTFNLGMAVVLARPGQVRTFRWMLMQVF